MKKVVGVAILVVIISGVGMINLKKQKSAQVASAVPTPVTKITPSIFPTFIPSPTLPAITIYRSTTGNISPKNRFLYAIKTKGFPTSGRYWPVYTVYAADKEGNNKMELFTIGGINNMPELRYRWERKSIFINLEHSLLEYSLEIGKISDIYKGESGGGYILGDGLSHSGKEILINYSSDYIQRDVENILILIDLEKKTQKIIFTGKPNFDFRHFFYPTTWSPDDSQIYLAGAMGTSGELDYARIDRDGKNLKLIPEMTTAGKFSLDGKYYAVTPYAKDDVVDWGCMGDKMTRLKLYSIENNQSREIEHNTQYKYGVEGWSPDSTKFVYTKKKYLSGGCLAEFAPEEAYIYDVNNKSSASIGSASKQMADWYSDGIEIKLPTEQEYLGYYK